MSEDRKEIVGAVLRWRQRLASDTGPHRAARARLRRCATILDALIERETIELVKSVRAVAKITRDREDRLAIIAIALAHNPNDGKGAFATALGHTAEGKSPGEGDRPKFAPARFTSLVRQVEQRDWEGLIRSLRRAFAILGDTPFSAPGLVADLLYLDDRTLQRWTYDYWQTSAPETLAPLLLNETEALS